VISVSTGFEQGVGTGYVPRNNTSCGIIVLRGYGGRNLEISKKENPPRYGDYREGRCLDRFK